MQESGEQGVAAGTKRRQGLPWFSSLPSFLCNTDILSCLLRSAGWRETLNCHLHIGSFGRHVHWVPRTNLNHRCRLVRHLGKCHTALHSLLKPQSFPAKHRRERMETGFGVCQSTKEAWMTPRTCSGIR